MSPLPPLLYTSASPDALTNMQSIFLRASLTNHINFFLLIALDRNSSFLPDNSVSAVKLITGYILCPLLRCVLSLIDGHWSLLISAENNGCTGSIVYCRTVKSAYGAIVPWLSLFVPRYPMK